MNTDINRLIAEKLRRLKEEDPDELRRVLMSLTEAEAELIAYDWSIWGRPAQQYDIRKAPKITFWQCARGWGKTRTGAEAVRHAVENGCRRIALIGPTAGDARDVMVLGESGLLSVFPPHKKPEYQPSYARVVFSNGAEAKLFSAEDPNRLRGPQHDFCWMDEPASINNRDMFDQMLIGNRIGVAKTIVTGTPMVNDIVLELHRRRNKDVEIRFGSTKDNADNLAGDYISQIYDMYKGTRYEKQELEGELILSNPGALWSYELIDQQTMGVEEEVPELEKVTIGIDPATSAGKNSDNTGIVVCGLGVDGVGYVLGDYTGKYTADQWTNKVVSLYDSYAQQCPVRIVIERNAGGALVVDVLTRNRPMLPVDDVFSTRSKIARAEPVSLLYEQGKVRHTRNNLQDLVQEMVSYQGKRGEKSPDRLDSLVFALTSLMPVKNRVTKGFELLM
jgi:phage terminase large subunit-like protein